MYSLLLGLILGVLLFLPLANAQTNHATNVASPQAKEANPDDGLHVAIAPYLWFADVHGTTGALGHDAAVNASFGDVFEYLNIGAMCVVEVRYNRIIMPLDFMWMKLSDDKALPSSLW